MIRQSAFVTKRRLLKGALHCHTTRSDGRGTPEDVIRLHKEHGYDFMALTDHNNYNYANYGDTPMLIIPGMERQFHLLENGEKHDRNFHSVCIGPLKEDGNGYEQDQRFDEPRILDQHELQPYLDEIHRNGNMTVLCHPQWSGIYPRDFCDLEGHFAMELCNAATVQVHGIDDNNGGMWDDLLVHGKRIWGVAADDGHQMAHHCLGWVMVNSEPTVASVLKALRDGAFYASCGPEIHDFYVDDEGNVTVECSPCREIRFRCGVRPFDRIRAGEGETLTSSCVRLKPWMTYIRVEVVDEEGRIAWSNPIFL